MLLKLLRRFWRRPVASPPAPEPAPPTPPVCDWRQPLDPARTPDPPPVRSDDSPAASDTPGEDTGYWRYSALCDAFQNLLFGQMIGPDMDLDPTERQVLAEVDSRLERMPPEQLLPRLPDTLHHLLRELNDDEASARRVEELIRRDPVLAGDVIRLANSAWFRRRAKPVTSIEQAVLLIGRDGLRDLVTALLMQPVLKVKPVYFRLFGRTLWEHSLTCAQSAVRVANRMGENESTAYFLGLVHNVGRIALFRLLMDGFAKVKPGINPRPLLFRRLIQSHDYDLAADIVAGWGVDPPLVQALREQKLALDPDSLIRLSPLGQVLFMANLVSTAHLLLREERRSPEQVEACLEDFGLSLRHLSDLFFAEPEE